MDTNRFCGTLRGAFATLALAAASGAALPQSAISLRSGETVELHSAYWVDNCKSLLKGFGEIDVLESPPGVTVSLKEQPVMARRQNCPTAVPGAMVMATAKDITAKATATLKYRVRYNTEDGQKMSTHTYKLELYPQPPDPRYTSPNQPAAAPAPSSHSRWTFVRQTMSAEAIASSQRGQSCSA